MPAPDIQIGDRITFRALRRWSNAKATRVVTGFYRGNPTVRLEGCAGFVVGLAEIIKFHKRED